MSRPKLVSLDAFAKTVEDARIRTASGGMITLVCLFVVLLLCVNEYNDYRTVINRPELVVDRDINKRLDINLDISFPHLPCDLFSVDILDVSGDHQVDVLKSGFVKYRLTAAGEIESEDIKINSDLEGSMGVTTSNDPNYCGSCYGAVDQSMNEGKPADQLVCCNSCESVKQAYAAKSWGFYDGENIEQCEREGYVQRITSQLTEGCRVKGQAEIRRIAGNLHFAPGASNTVQGSHVHDLSLFNKHPDLFNFDHIVNHFSFGPDPYKEESLVPNSQELMQSTHPLDHHEAKAGQKYHLFSYYMKVVATRFEFLNKRKIETNQFSVITHDRPLEGGRDDDHQHTLHAKGGIPGLFIHFEISPMKIINKECYSKTWSSFVLGVISSIAGVLTVGTILDRTVWAADRMLRSKKQT